MASRLSLYNAALRACGETKINDLADSSERRRILDDVYDDTLAWCLEEGYWNFALRTVQVDEDTGITLGFGWTSAFTKPDDWVRTAKLSADGNFSYPLLRYSDEPSLWLADVTPIFVQYVSDDDAFGNDLSIWPASYQRFVELALADRAVLALSQNRSRKDELERLMKMSRRDALSKDAMNEAQPRKRFFSTWVASRGSGNGGDRGSNSRLTG